MRSLQTILFVLHDPEHNLGSIWFTTERTLLKDAT